MFMFHIIFVFLRNKKSVSQLIICWRELCVAGSSRSPQIAMSDSTVIK